MADTGRGTNSQLFTNLAKHIHELKERLNENKERMAPELFEKTVALIESVEHAAIDLEKNRKEGMGQAYADIEMLKTEFETQNAMLVATLQNLQAQLSKFLSKPQTYVTFIRFIRMEKIPGTSEKAPLIEVRDANGITARVFFFVKDVDYKMLTYGQQLVVYGVEGPSHVHEVLSESPAVGVEATVSEILGNDKEGMRLFLRIGERETGIMAHLAAHLSPDTIKDGTRVLLNPQNGIVFEVLPKKEKDLYAIEDMPTTTLDDIGGYQELVEEIKEEIVWPLLYPEKYAKRRQKGLRGLCLVGGPGMGKTMFAKAIFNLLRTMFAESFGKDPKDIKGFFRTFTGPEIQNKYVGETERTMRELFAELKAAASPENPAVLFIDEAEAIFPIRGSGISSDVEKTNVTQFTGLMDGLEDRGNIIVILATNRVDLIDKAVTRSGRCDRIITIPRPDKNAARGIFKKYLLPEDVHPKYLKSPIYTPRDRDGASRSGKDGRVQKEKFNKDPHKVATYLIAAAVDRMYDKNRKENQFLKVKFSGEDEWTYMRYGDFASGALIANIVERAQKMAIKREIVTKKATGVDKKDLMLAIEQAFSELRAPQTLGFHEWLAIEGVGNGKRVEDYKFLPANGTLEEDDD